MSDRPANGVLRLFEWKRAASTHHCAVTSSATTSAGAPGWSVPPGSPNTRAGTVLMRRISCGSVNAPPCTSSVRSEEHTSELQSRLQLVCRLLLEKKKKTGWY